MKTGIIFDLDGTLWDSVEPVVDAWNEVIRNNYRINYTLTIEESKKLMGKTITEISSIILSEVDKDRALEIIEECCKKELIYLEEKGGRLYPNLENTLKKLLKKYNLYIVSNCQDGYIEIFLTYHKLDKYFSDYENHGRTKLSKGENIKLIIERNKLDKAVYIGDTQGDYVAAKYAGIPFVHAKYGFGTVTEATSFINTFDELLKILSKKHIYRHQIKCPHLYTNTMNYIKKKMVKDK
ncbi:HAD family hydrolase [Sedimentibacter sp.]|uniref:HAD family hydrolase n=1 Tax=Sedimentibacter sp. TaxID=1960295 RepID=UPI0028A7733A|nr:HAD family hydrolase [Sedimentibacter sp.]